MFLELPPLFYYNLAILRVETEKVIRIRENVVGVRVNPHSASLLVRVVLTSSEGLA